MINRAGFDSFQIQVGSSLERLSNDEADTVAVHLGEKSAGPDSIDRAPGGTIRHRSTVLPLEAGTHTYTVRIPPDERNFVHP